MTVVLTLDNPVQGPLVEGVTRNQKGNIDADGVRGLCYNNLRRMNSCLVQRKRYTNKHNRLHVAVLHNVLTMTISL